MCKKTLENSTEIKHSQSNPNCVNQNWIGTVVYTQLTSQPNEVTCHASHMILSLNLTSIFHKTLDINTAKHVLSLQFCLQPLPQPPVQRACCGGETTCQTTQRKRAKESMDCEHINSDTVPQSTKRAGRESGLWRRVKVGESMENLFHVRQRV